MRVLFTANLHRYTNGVGELDARAESVAALMHVLDEKIPGIRHYLVDDRGSLRRHVNVFVNGAPVADRERLADALDEDATVHILQAISGG